MGRPFKRGHALGIELASSADISSGAHLRGLRNRRRSKGQVPRLIESNSLTCSFAPDSTTSEHSERPHVLFWDTELLHRCGNLILFFRNPTNSGNFGAMTRLLESLRGAGFDQREFEVICEAYIKARKSSRDNDDAHLVNEIIARRILSFAKRGERDPDQLRAKALAELPMISAPPLAAMQ